jgi:hypothetical protein
MNKIRLLFCEPYDHIPNELLTPHHVSRCCIDVTWGHFASSAVLERMRSQAIVACHFIIVHNVIPYHCCRDVFQRHNTNVIRGYCCFLGHSCANVIPGHRVSSFALMQSRTIVAEMSFNNNTVIALLRSDISLLQNSAFQQWSSEPMQPVLEPGLFHWTLRRQYLRHRRAPPNCAACHQWNCTTSESSGRRLRYSTQWRHTFAVGSVFTVRWLVASHQCDRLCRSLCDIAAWRVESNELRKVSASYREAAQWRRATVIHVWDFCSLTYPMFVNYVSY